MTLSTAEREALARRSSLTAQEDFLVSNALDHLHSNAKLLKHFLANDDRCAKLEAALVQYMIDSRPNIPSVPVEYQTANYTIKFDPATLTGSFEHNTRAGFASGNLTFESERPDFTELVDYDGVTQLPKEVLSCLENQGFVVDGIDEDAP